MPCVELHDDAVLLVDPGRLDRGPDRVRGGAEHLRLREPHAASSPDAGGFSTSIAGSFRSSVVTPARTVPSPATASPSPSPMAATGRRSVTVIARSWGKSGSIVIEATVGNPDTARSRAPGSAFSVVISSAAAVRAAVDLLLLVLHPGDLDVVDSDERGVAEPEEVAGGERGRGQERDHDALAAQPSGERPGQRERRPGNGPRDPADVGGELRRHRIRLRRRRRKSSRRRCALSGSA